MTLEELRKMTVVKLREEAMKYPDVKGTSGMKKDQLVALLAEKLGIETEEHEAPAPATKLSVKKKIKELKQLKREAIEKNDRAMVSLCRQKIRTQKRHLRKILGQS